MFCPNCDKEMKDKCYRYYGLGDWDEEYAHELHEEYVCKNCKIKYLNGKWQIPKDLLPTKKQMTTIAMIDYYLNTDKYRRIKTKQEAIKFIGENLKRCIEVKENYEEDFDDFLYMSETEEF